MEAIDLQTLVDQVNEAQALLAHRDELEREIVGAERRRDRVLLELATAEKDLQDTCTKASDESARHEHEKRRYTITLEAHQKDVDGKMRELDTQHRANMRRASDAHQQHLATLASERQTAETDLLKLKDEHTRLRAMVADLKHRLRSL